MCIYCGVQRVFSAIVVYITIDAYLLFVIWIMEGEIAVAFNLALLLQPTDTLRFATVFCVAAAQFRCVQLCKGIWKP